MGIEQPKEVEIYDGERLVPREQSTEDKLGLTTEQKTDSNIHALVRQLESGSIDAFDRKTIKLLSEVVSEQNKRSLANYFAGPMQSLLERAGPVGAGILAAKEAAATGVEYVSAAARDSLLSKYLLNESAIELPAVAGDTTQTGLRGVFESVKENVVAPITQMAQENLAPVVDATVKAANEHGVRPMIESISSLVGTAAAVPAGAVGWLGGSMLTGGAMGVLREWRDRASFKRLGEMIEASRNQITSRESEGDDARLSLIVMEKKILEDKEHMGFRLTNDEWLAFAGAVREARVSLINEKIKIPEIISSPEARASLENQQALVEKLINRNQELTAVDRDEAATILAQYDQILGRDSTPVEKHLESFNSTKEKVRRYGGAFVSGAVNASGIPLAWKVAKTAAYGTYKLGKKVVTMNPLA